MGGFAWKYSKDKIERNSIEDKTDFLRQLIPAHKSSDLQACSMVKAA